MNSVINVIVRDTRKYCDKLNAEKTALKYHVLVADNWHVWRITK